MTDQLAISIDQAKQIIQNVTRNAARCSKYGQAGQRDPMPYACVDVSEGTLFVYGATEAEAVARLFQSIRERFPQSIARELELVGKVAELHREAVADLVGAEVYVRMAIEAKSHSFSRQYRGQARKLLSLARSEREFAQRCGWKLP